MSKFYSKDYQAKIVKQIAQKVMNKNVETKHATFSTTDGQEIFHNNFISITPNILATTQGVSDPPTSNQDCRIGDQIMLRGASLKMMVELNERYSDVTCRLLVVRAAKGDTPDRSSLFNGRSGNKMLDTINTERYSILYQKYIKLRAPNYGTQGGATTGTVGTTTGVNTAASNQTLSRATKIVKVWIPGKKFSRGGKITYENASSQVKFFDYHVLLYAYSNISTSQDVYYVARLNDYVQELYYKDA